MMLKLLLIVSTCVVVLSACKNGILPEETPALVSEPGPESRAELQAVVSKALGGVDVLLAEDVMTETSVLLVERQARRDPQGRRLPGRDLGTPEKFQLLLSGDHCVLLQQSTGERWDLQETRCIPE